VGTPSSDTVRQVEYRFLQLSTFLELPNGVPSHDTFRRVFTLIDPDALEAGFAAWVGPLASGFEREVVAIDGKTIRRSFDHSLAPSSSPG
jgi:hypothetical protein